MGAFSDQISLDLSSVFFNFDEFAEPHQIDALTNVPAIVDTDIDQTLKQSNDRREGANKGKIQLFVMQSSIPKDPHVDQIMNLDKVQYRIIICNLSGGMWELTLEAIR